jgi:hypothetical protein
MKESSKFAFSCTPYVPTEEEDWDPEPYLVKYLSNEQRYDIPILNLEAPYGTSIFMNKVDRITAGDMKDELNKRFRKKLEKLSEVKPMPDVIPEMQPPPTHDYCQVCKDDYQDYFAHVESQQHATKCRLSLDLFKQVEEWMGSETEAFEASFAKAEDTPKEEISIVSKVQTDVDTRMIGKFGV